MDARARTTVDEVGLGNGRVAFPLPAGSLPESRSSDCSNRVGLLAHDVNVLRVARKPCRSAQSPDFSTQHRWHVECSTPLMRSPFSIFVCAVVTSFSACPGPLCEGSPSVVAPPVACSAEYANVEYCTAPASGTFFTCAPKASCWGVASDGPCFPPLVFDGGLSCPSGQSWKGRDCGGTDAGVRSCFGRTLAQCGQGCWYPIGVCLADGGQP